MQAWGGGKRVSAGLRAGGMERGRLWEGKEELVRGQFGQSDSLKVLLFQGWTRRCVRLRDKVVEL